MKTVKTEKGTVLPLTNLKGKDYLMVAYRLQWFNETESNFEIDTQFLLLTDEQTVARATVKVTDKTGKVIKQASATKRETKKDFSDHTEKAETSAVGRALAMLGYGTQFAVSDLDEGDRLADSPVISVPQMAIPQGQFTANQTENDNKQMQAQLNAAPKVASFKKSTFKKPAASTPAAPTQATGTNNNSGWE